MLNVGVFGVGHLGRFHLQQWKTIHEVNIVGFYDPNDHQAQLAEQDFGVKRFQYIESLMNLVDIVDVVTPTTFHYEIAKKALLMSKHVFIEKPFTHTIEEALELIKLVKEANVKCQIGHVERFNPAFLSIQDLTIDPMFIECHRLATFNPRGTDVSVILDLMIHDIDIILALVKSPVKRIAASGVAVLSETPDITNARIEFENGCVANLTSSRMSLKRMRKMRLFQRDGYIGLDFLNKSSEIIKLTDKKIGALDIPLEMPNGDHKVLAIQHPEIPESNAIRTELYEFVSSIIADKPVKVSAKDGYEAMAVAFQILKKMNLHSELHNEI
jgi:predicted dehydrogenase